MADTQNKVLSQSSPDYAPSGSRKAITCSYPKPGQEQSVTLQQGPFHDDPRGSAITDTAAKSGQKQHP